MYQSYKCEITIYSGKSLHSSLSCTKIHCTQFVSISIRNVPSLHMWPVLDAVSLSLLLENHVMSRMWVFSVLWCLFASSTIGSANFRSFVMDIEDTVKRLAEATEQLLATTNLNEELKAIVQYLNKTNAEHEVKMRELNETNERHEAKIKELNEANEDLAAEIWKIKGEQDAQLQGLAD